MNLFCCYFAIALAIPWRESLAYNPCGFRSARLPRHAWNSLTLSVAPPLYASEPEFPVEYRSFTSPLLSDKDWMVGFGAKATAASQDDEEELLGYLPWFVLQQELPLSKNLITKATRQYVYADTRGDPKVNMTDVMHVINSEYKSADVPVLVDGRTYSTEQNQSHRKIMQILSFAAFHRLPKEITALLFGDDEDLQECKVAFLRTGWEGVYFPQGMAIRLPRNRLHSKLDRYQPIPRRWLKVQNIRTAERAVREAGRVIPPSRQLLTREAFMDSLNRDLSTRRIREWKLFKDVMPFFPTKRNLFKFVVAYVAAANKTLKRVSQFVKQSARALLLSYGLLSFVWYNASFFWQWQKLSISFCLASGRAALDSSLHRIGRVLLSVYSDLPISPVFLIVALALAPVSNRILKSLSSRVGDDNKALLIVGSLLAVSHLGIGTSILFLDAAILRSLVL